MDADQHHGTMQGTTQGGMRGGHSESGMSPAHMGPAMALVPLDAVTHRAIASGNWSDPNTWEGGRVPTEGARVWIPENLTVTVDERLAPEIKTIRADGTLSFATDRDTELKVDTLVTSHTGTLRIGSEAAPIEAGVTAMLIFADDGVIDRNWDPALISRGALLHGRTEIYGAEKTGFTTLAEQPVAGANSITLSTIPVGWQVGDEITIAGTDPNDPDGDEVVTITAVDGATVSFSTPLMRDHVAPQPGLDVHVANLTRNVEITSENDGALNRGHVMFMHTNDVDIRYVSFDDLGRSDKRAGLNDWVLETGNEASIGAENTEVMDLGGANVRGRYSVHFHRGGTEGEPGRVEGAVVRDDPGWAYVNHSSNVDFIGNVSHNIVGAAYNTEAGDEVGNFIDNIAIRTVNPDANLNPAEAELDAGQAPDARAETQDYGFQGDGFWFHGSGVTVDGNVVSGATGHAYIYWQLGLVERGLGERLVDVADLPNGDLIGPDGTLVRTKHVPVPSFDGNVAYAATKGLQIHYLHTDNRDDADDGLVQEGLLAPVPQAYEDQLQSTFSNIDFWNIRLSGIDVPYASRLTFENVSLLGTGAEESIGLRLDHFANDNNFTVRNVDIDGFQIGLTAPRQGDASIDGAEISAISGIRIGLPAGEPRNLEISDVEFTPLGPSFEGTPEAQGERQNIVLDPTADFAFGGGLFEGEAFEEDFLSDLEFFADEDSLDEDDEEENDEEFEPPEGLAAHLLPDRITFAEEGEAPVGLFFDEQAADFVPVPEGSELAFYLPEELVGLTNAEMQDLYGILFGGALIPQGATPDGRVEGGVVGPALPPFETFPPSVSPLIQLLQQDLDDDDNDDDGDDDDDDDRAFDDDALSGDAALLAKLYIVLYGRMPDGEGFDFWLDQLSGNASFGISDLAWAFTTAGEFDALYGDATIAEMVTSFYTQAFDRAPDTAGFAFWTDVMARAPELGLVELALSFARSGETDAVHGATIQSFVENRVGEYSDADDDNGEPNSGVLQGTAGADQFRFPEVDYSVVTEFDPALDLIDITGLGTPDDVEVLAEEDGTTLLLGEGDLFLPGAQADQITPDIFIF
ncbi:MAG: G8 domain-containing protein [Pseudomonadota bacterium]